MRNALILSLFLSVFTTAAFAEAPYRDAVPQTLSSFPDLQADFGGEIGKRVHNVVENWSVRAPKANPAMLSVFSMRERSPKSSEYYVPWVGEFVGKYLENSILLLQASDSQQLQQIVPVVINALISQQDRDGYLGVYSRGERLCVCWDLWGHYHAMTALMLYYERTGNADALEAARRAGFFFEKIFYRTDQDGEPKGVKDVGSDEVNFAIMTALCQLYRLTSEQRFLDDAHKVLTDLESRGDFYREGLAGTEFFRTPQPRWESLHTILGLEEFYRIEGDDSYRRAFLNLWESVYKRDVHNNGSFSSGEQAIGSPFKNEAIETCCSVAWIALTVEALRRTGDPRCADALENSLYNAVCAYTHPSGSWCAYNTPMNGRREASTQTIVFQARPGQPELNCCSVNSPRGFAELVNWGVMNGKDDQGQDALYVNYYGEGAQTFAFAGKQTRLVQKTNYPREGRIELEVGPVDGSEAEFTLFARVPAWAKSAALVTPDGEKTELTPGKYAAIKRVWKLGESVALEFPPTLRYLSGDGDFAGKALIYYGPLLLAYDQSFNRRDPDSIPTISPKALENANVELVNGNPVGELVGYYSPQIFIKLDGEPAAKNDENIADNNTNDNTNDAANANDAPGAETAAQVTEPLFLVDFAFAGALGTTYASWLPCKETAPPIPACDSPVQDATVARGAIPFSWRKVVGAQTIRFKVVVADSEDFSNVLFETASDDGRCALALPEQTNALEPRKTYYWKIVAENEFGAVESLAPGRRFQVDPDLPLFDLDGWKEKREGNRKMRTLIDQASEKTSNAAEGEDGAMRFNGADAIVTYELEAFPRVEFDAELEFKLEGTPEKGQIAEIVSAWNKGMDDPLRVAVDANGAVYGSVESSRGARYTAKKSVEPNVWHKLRVTKVGREWTMEIDGEEEGRLNVEEILSTDSTAIGLGGNPKYRGQPEFFRGEIRNFTLRGVCD